MDEDSSGLPSTLTLRLLILGGGSRDLILWFLFNSLLVLEVELASSYDPFESKCFEKSSLVGMDISLPTLLLCLGLMVSLTSSSIDLLCLFSAFLLILSSDA
jgi:hypothetical protein